MAASTGLSFEARDFEAGHRDGADAGDYLISQIDFTTMDDAGGLRYPVDIATALADTDGSETLSIVVAGVPDGAPCPPGPTTATGHGAWRSTRWRDSRFSCRRPPMSINSR